MFLKATVKCSCGAKYDLFSNEKHDSATCPNCSKVFSESNNLIEILRIAKSMKIGFQYSDEGSSDLFSFFNEEDLTITTDE